MRHIFEACYLLETYTPAMARFRAGFLLKEILQRSYNKSISYKPLTQKLWIYSGHDMTISNILNAMGLFDVSI